MYRYILPIILSLVAGMLAAQPVLSCYDIQYTMEPDGISPYLDQEVTVLGIVSGTGYNGNRYYITDETGGPWSGLFIYNNSNQPSLGDLVQITGIVDEYYDLTEITDVSSFQVISQNNPLPEPSILSTGTLAGVAEAWESVLVTVQNVSVSQLPNYYEEFYVNDGSGECQIDNGFFASSHEWDGISNGMVFASISGIVDYSFNVYAINPRFQADLVQDGAAVSLHLPNLTAGIDSEIIVALEAYNLASTQGYDSYALDLYYDPVILQHQEVIQTATLSETGDISVNSQPGHLNISYQSQYPLHGTGNLLKFSFLTRTTGRSELNLPNAVFGEDLISHIVNGSVTVNGNYNTLGDTLTVIQRPLLNIPAIHIPGETMTITCLAPQNTTGFEAWLLHDQKRINLPLVSSSWQNSPQRWELQVSIPQVAVFELYDLEVNADGGIHDTTRNAVQVIPSRKENYYFVHITDLHLPNRLFYPNPGYDTDSTSVVDFRAVMDDINLIRPEFVLITGDLINEGELENFNNQYWFGWTQKILSEMEVPVYVTAGNHDIGGWNSTPPPSGSSRRNWWRYFGWSWLDNTDYNWQLHTQDYYFTYNNTLYIGMEAYNNYDNFRPAIYGSDSFTYNQLMWLNSTLAAHPQHRKVLFHHFDFRDQLDINALGLDMSIFGHIHSNSGDIYSYPYSLSTRSVCDGNRAYRVVQVSNTGISPKNTIYAGSSGTNIHVSYLPANNATADSVMAIVTNNISLGFNNTLLKFRMPLAPEGYLAAGGVLEQVDIRADHAVCYVRVNLLPSSVKEVSVFSRSVSNQDAMLIPSPARILGIYPNPMRNLAEIELEMDKVQSSIVVELYNLRGQKMDEISFSNLKAGSNLLPINLNYASGMYFLRVKDMPGTSRKLVILK
ncbi:MAG: metallophosphoesterase [Candidatus Cloacimonadaceae bacterium]|jgi:3',5'-cyclic AMP phosphodiesterase CpdA|nr:metallophosphoesterase [Candidatus Cloacimonadaceae bacterium]